MADKGEDYRTGFLSREEKDAYGREPWLKDMFMGQAVHRATASELRSGGYQYRTRGPDFLDPASNEIELITPG